MGIDDIIQEQSGYATPQQPQQSPTDAHSPQVGSGTVITLDLGAMGRQEAVFWMNVLQTAALLYIAWQL